MGGLRVGARIGVVVAALALLVPAGASASSLTTDHGIINYQAAPGEENQVKATALTIDLDPQGGLNPASPLAGTWLTPLAIIEDPGATIISAAGNGCVGLSTHMVLCLALNGYGLQVSQINADLGDGDDTFSGTMARTPGVIRGGTGNDRLTVTSSPISPNIGAGYRSLYGGDGTDVLQGGQGPEEFEGGAGPDDIHGGGGFDNVIYYNTPEVRPSLAVTLDDVADDGAPGEGDNVHSDNYKVQGIFNGPNHLVGSALPNWFTGGPQPDVLDGGAGDDNLDGFPGADDLTGGPGRDELDGDDGDDTLHARDGEIDTNICDAGSDSVIGDPIDIFATTCESVDTGP